MGDPSCFKQYFPRLSADIYCCRFWWLKKWEYNILSFPFWRIYYNFNKGGVIEYEGKELPMEPDKIYLIAPNTDYKSKIAGHRIPHNSHCLEGGDIGAINPAERSTFLSEKETIRHLFIHFILLPMNNKILPGIHFCLLKENLKDKINELCTYLTENYESGTFSIHIYWLIQSLICEIFQYSNEEIWKPTTCDLRVNKIIDYIENNYEQDLSNKFLADMVCMSPNSFSRLFKNNMGVQLQKYIKKKRIDYAYFMLLTTDMTIDEITYKTGFQNRFHFTRLFHEITGTTPAKYKMKYRRISTAGIIRETHYKDTIYENS